MTPVDPVMFRRGLFNMRTRRFGRVAELLVERLTNATAARNQFHDLYDDKLKHRIEVKFCTVNAEHDERITLDNLLGVVEAAGRERAVPFRDWQAYKFDANIQQVKRSEFDILYYGLFFADDIVMFKANSSQIKTQAEIVTGDLNAVQIYFSDKQHKGNVGEGQFHINQKTLNIHLNHFHYKTISYSDFLTLIG